MEVLVEVEGEADFFAAVIHPVAVTEEATEAEAEGMHLTRKSSCAFRRSNARFLTTCAISDYKGVAFLGVGTADFSWLTAGV